MKRHINRSISVFFNDGSANGHVGRKDGVLHGVDANWVILDIGHRFEGIPVHAVIRIEIYRSPDDLLKRND